MSFDNKLFPPRNSSGENQRLASALTSEANTSCNAVWFKRVLFGDGYGAFASSGVRSTLKTITLDELEKLQSSRTAERSHCRRGRHTSKYA